MRTLPIDPIVTQAGTSLEHAGVVMKGLPLENLQSRVRSLLLMAIANAEGSFLLGTGNKSEVALGYTTLYGDLCGALLPLGDLFKTEVYELARFLNRQGEVIPPSILKRTPTAELRPNQKDTDDLPEYNLLDPVLRLLVLEGRTPDEVASATGMDVELVGQLAQRVMRFEFKRRQGPCILRVSTRAFGTDVVYPIVNQRSFPVN
jgi:NAD+ synthetase